MRACVKTWGIASLTSNFGTIWGRKIRFTPYPLLPLAKKHPISIDCEDGWPLSWFASVM